MNWMRQVPTVPQLEPHYQSGPNHVVLVDAKFRASMTEQGADYQEQHCIDLEAYKQEHLDKKHLSRRFRCRCGRRSGWVLPEFG